MRDGDPAPLSGITQVAVPVAADFGGDYGAVTDQRHRAVFNGIWRVAGGFQISGIYFHGSGERQVTSYGGDQRAIGATGSARLRPNGTIVPRNAFVGKPVHRADVRFQQSLKFGGRRSADLIAEVFNAVRPRQLRFLHVAGEQPEVRPAEASSNLGYAPRTIQLGFRLTFQRYRVVVIKMEQVLKLVPSLSDAPASAPPGRRGRSCVARPLSRDAESLELCRSRM